MSKFIGYTVGLNVLVNGRRVLAKVEFNYKTADSVELKLVSARNLNKIGGVAHKVISLAKFSDRPYCHYNSVKEAAWAFELLGCEV